MTKNAAVIVAAGRGSRLGGDGGPKQYRTVGNKSVLQRTIDCFVSHPQIDLIQVVIHSDDHELYSKSVEPDKKLLKPVFGGASRQASCKAGTDAIACHNCATVLIHDAARPFLSPAVISNVLDGVSSGTCSLPAVAVADTLKNANADGHVASTLERNNLYLAQTPQGFVCKEIHKAHAQALAAGLDDFTDDAAVAEWAGLRVKLVSGDRNNFKITTQNDLDAARERVEMTTMMISDVRTGSGYDVHTLGRGDRVILCGIEIPHSQSLQGHSDADVGLHALTDALLGTIGEGDIGSHFPPSDPKWKDASSDQFLKHAVNLVSQAGGMITNLDVTLVCEAPKIGPHREAMRNRVAEICGIELQRVSVKATTNERIGFIGREEGIAALASANASFGPISGSSDV